MTRRRTRGGGARQHPKLGLVTVKLAVVAALPVGAVIAKVLTDEMPLITFATAFYRKAKM